MVDKNGVALKAGDMVLIKRVGIYTLIEYEAEKFALINAPMNTNRIKDFIKWEEVNKKKIEKYEPDTSWFKMFRPEPEPELQEGEPK
jgi:hypothetical protein